MLREVDAYFLDVDESKEIVFQILYHLKKLFMITDL